MSFLEVVTLLFDGFKISMLIFAVTLLCGAPLGLPIAFCSMSKFRVVKYTAKVFVWIIRGVPLMLQIFIIYYLPSIIFGKESDIWTQISEYFTTGNQLSDAGGVIAVMIAFVINYACYFSEIYRGGIESISKGQYEAGYVLGLKKSQVFKRIILKQVIKHIIPPMSNEIITLIKDTALANCIMVGEIIYKANYLASTKALVWPLFFTGIFYLIFVGILTLLFGYIEKKLSYFRS